MPKTKAKNTATAFIEYKPAELHKNKEWRIVYYAKIPAKNKFQRFRLRVPKVKSISERNRLAKKMVLAVNEKLALGWSPFYEDKSNQYKSITDVFDLFLNITEREVQEGIKRKVTSDSYSSILRIFKKYLSDKHKNIRFVIELDIYVVSSFLDFVYMKRKVSARTYNNYLRFLSSFFGFCISKGFLKQNPVENIKKKPTTKKKREVLTPIVKEYLNDFSLKNKEYFCLCMATYFCFIRRTELTKIKVKDVHLSKKIITILAVTAKNKKTENVTIPNAFAPLLAEHLKTAKNDDFLFSANDFKAGAVQLKPKKISDVWAKFRRKYKIDNKFQFYSLKDTGITDLLNTGIPAIKVRNQARHHDLKMTEIYTARNESNDLAVQNADFNF